MSEMKTFVFTDIVRSVNLKSQMAGGSDAERDQAFISTILTPHRHYIERELDRHNGRVVSTAGDGHFLVFSNTISAAKWAIDVHRYHRDQPIKTPDEQKVEVRMSLHVGFPMADPQEPDNFIGKAVDYAARLGDLASGGQVLISTAALGLLRDAGLDGVKFHDHGQRELRGIGSVDVHELLYDNRKPSETRQKPAEKVSREWTVLPATEGLTDYLNRAPGGSSETQAATATTPAAPARIGNYELGELLGAGGMGNVYKARHSQMGRQRALKVIKPHFVEAGHEEVIRRFYREIQAIGHLEHPNIVVAIDSSTPTDKTHYLVMEYVDGIGADTLLQRNGPLGVSEACEIIRQAAIGLEYIHRQQMVHRDIKPSNLMIATSSDGSLEVAADPSNLEPVAPAVVKILDLGLALLVTDDQPRLTQMGHGAMGTAMYMSPEQWSTTSVDIRSDIYSLGCTLYHLLTGRPPYYDSDLKPQRAHEKAPLPNQFGRSDVPKSLQKVVRKMMAKRPQDRYSRPAEVVEALAPLAVDSQLNTLVERHKRSVGTTLAGGETLAGGTPASDTLSPRLPPGSQSLSWESTQPRPLWRRMVTPLAIVAAIGTAVLMAAVSNQLKDERAKSLQAKRTKLVSLSKQVAPRLADEIDKRLEILERKARSTEIRSAMTALYQGRAEAEQADGNPVEDRGLWAPVQQWLNETVGENRNRVAFDSWFITDNSGLQLARYPQKSTIGRSYASRDYFHGMGRNLTDEEVNELNPQPLTEKHISSVYRSSSTNLLKVAFSVPIRAKDNQVLGVFAMSINLGAFKVLEDTEMLPPPLEAVLIDLRPDSLGDGTQRGLVLHHPELGKYDIVTDPFRLSPELLTKVKTTLDRRNRFQSATNPIISGYSDLLDRPGHGEYIGAFEPVVIRNLDGQTDTEWLIIMQEEIKE